MSKYSTSGPTIPATSNSEFDDYAENLETSPSAPTGENTNSVLFSETVTTNPPQSPIQPDSSNTPPSSPSARNSKQNFLSLFKKKETVNSISNASSNKPISASPQQPVVPTNASIYNNKDTTEETSSDHFATEHNVSQSVIGSISVPNLAASNTDASLEAEYDALMKQQRFVIGSSDVSYDLSNGIAGKKPLNSQFKKSEKKKGDLVSAEKTDDKGFKSTMKNTMRKTSTFFKKLGNKQNPDNQLQRNVRLPLPDFQDVSNPPSPSLEELQNTSSLATDMNDTTESSNQEESHLDTNDETTLSNNDDSSDEQESLQRTLKDYASVYANLQTDGENRRRSGLYRLSLLSANKSVPDNIGRTYEWNEQTSDNGNENVQLTNKDPKDRNDSSNTFSNIPVIKNEKEDVIPIKEKDSRVKLTTRNPKLSSKEEASTMDKRTWLLTKPMRPESILDSGLSPSTIPKRPDRKLPDIPKTVPASESDVSQSRSPRQASSVTSSYYETASGSTTTLHTAPPSPITDALIEANYITDGTPKIQVDDFVLTESVLTESPIDRNFDGRDEEMLWAKARIAAKKCFDGDETFIKKEEITKYLGGHESINSRSLKCYIEYYDFSNLRLDEAFRRLCEKLYIKGETQQVDRILEAFSIRYWECNPKSIYGSSDIVHAIAYSILLLNTDLHVAQLANKMSRSQFVRNTMAAVNHAQTIIATQNINESYEDDQSTITSFDTNTTNTTGTSVTARPRRSGSVKSWRSNPTSMLSGFSRQWESEIESLLKEIYSAIKLRQILQPILSSSDKSASSVESNTPTLGLKRSRSHLGHPNYSNSRVSALKKGLSAGTAKSRKNSNGRISPSPSSVSGGSDSSIGLDSSNRSSSSQTLPTTLSSFSLRHTSSSDTSTIPETVDEHDQDDDSDDRASVTTIESLSLYLSAPYAKEGLLVRKQYWESTNKRAKDRGWKECFVIIEKGDVKMYKFENNSSHSSMGLGAIGGGNWMTNATLMGEVNLRHTITNALPPPGYNRSRPYVFALSLSNGGLYFFQAGTAELVNEWVATCNYWAARMSKEPLTGGVSSMEYGWGRCLGSIDGEDLEDSRSIMSDGRSVLSANSTQISDRIVVSEWKAPIPPTVSSNFDEESQLAALKKYRVDLEKGLEEHKNFWEPMTKLFHPRSSNHTKAFSNWEKKSQWLLYEIVKYTTYIECINNSINIRSERRKEREKSKNYEDDKNKNDDTNTDDEAKREKEKKRAKARQSIKLLHRATWTPGDGFSLNLPKELLFGGALDNLEEEDDDNDDVSLPNGKMKSSTYPIPFDKKVIIEEEQRIGNFNSNIDYEAGHKWVDRFA